MSFQIVYPIQSTIYGDSFKEAIKNFIKLNHSLNIRNIIVKDQTDQVKATINYYKQDGRNKVGIDMYPVGLQYPIPLVTSNAYYPQPLIAAPFIPTVINIPNV
jgi:hypothetical protein